MSLGQGVGVPLGTGVGRRDSGIVTESRVRSEAGGGRPEMRVGSPLCLPGPDGLPDDGPTCSVAVSAGTAPAAVAPLEAGAGVAELTPTVGREAAAMESWGASSAVGGRSSALRPAALSSRIAVGLRRHELPRAPRAARAAAGASR